MKHIKLFEAYSSKDKNFMVDIFIDDEKNIIMLKYHQDL